MVETGPVTKESERADCGGARSLRHEAKLKSPTGGRGDQVPLRPLAPPPRLRPTRTSRLTTTAATHRPPAASPCVSCLKAWHPGRPHRQPDQETHRGAESLGCLFIALKMVVSTCRSSPPIAGIVRLERMRKVVSVVLGRLSGLELRSAGGARAGAVWQPCPSAPQAQRANGHSGSS